jgi:hypothetical protein
MNKGEFMTHKNYVLIAREISSALSGYAWQLPAQEKAVAIAVRDLALGLAQVFAENDDNFDAKYFLETCAK